MERDQTWHVDGQLVYAEEPEYQAKRTARFKLIGMFMTEDLAREAVNAHNKRCEAVLVASMGSG